MTSPDLSAPSRGNVTWHVTVRRGTSQLETKNHHQQLCLGEAS